MKPCTSCEHSPANCYVCDGCGEAEREDIDEGFEPRGEPCPWCNHHDTTRTPAERSSIARAGPIADQGGGVQLP